MTISGRCDLHIFLVHDEVDGLRCVGTVRAGSVRVRGRVGIPAGEGEGPVVSEAQHAEGEVLTRALQRCVQRWAWTDSKEVAPLPVDSEPVPPRLLLSASHALGGAA